MHLICNAFYTRFKFLNLIKKKFILLAITAIQINTKMKSIQYKIISLKVGYTSITFVFVSLPRKYAKVSWKLKCKNGVTEVISNGN